MLNLVTKPMMKVGALMAAGAAVQVGALLGDWAAKKAVKTSVKLIADRRKAKLLSVVEDNEYEYSDYDDGTVVVERKVKVAKPSPKVKRKKKAEVTA